MANEKNSGGASKSTPPSQDKGEQAANDAAKAIQAAGEQTGGEPRDTAREVAKATAEAQAAVTAADSAQAAGSDDEHPLVLGVDTQTLAGVPTFLEAVAGGPAAYNALIAGDPFGSVDNPGAHLPDGTIAHGTPVPATAAAYAEARARVGVPEPIKVDPTSGTSLLDTPGGQMMVPAGWTPDELAAEQGRRTYVKGFGTSFPAGEEAGAEVRELGGRPLDQKGEDHPAS